MPLVELPGFEEAKRRHLWAGSRLPVKFEGRRPCSRCSVGDIIRLGPYTQHALFRDAGYGAGIKTTVDVCFTCGASVIATIDAVPPPRRRAHAR